MAILSTDLKFYKSTVVTSDSTNGGRISENEAVSGVVNNIWPHVLKSERDAGSTLYRKVFMKVESDNNDTFISPQMWNEAPTDGDDYIILFPGTATDTQASLVETTYYGSGYIHTGVSAGAGAIVVTVEDSGIAGMFADGRTIRVTNKANPDAIAGTEEQFDINGTPSVSGADVTITLDGTLANAYLAGDKVQVLMEVSDVESSTDSVVVTSTSGVYDDTAYPITGGNSGAVDEIVTLTWTDATTFTVSGSVSGTLASGNITTDYTPAHPVNGNDMFTLEFAGFSGTYALNDTLVFNLNAAVIPFWLKRVVPAGASSLASNLNTTVVYGQSA